MLNAHGTDDSITETNIQQTGADVDNSDDDYSETDNNDTSAGNGDTMCDIMATDTQSSTYTFPYS